MDGLEVAVVVEYNGVKVDFSNLSLPEKMDYYNGMGLYNKSMALIRRQRVSPPNN